MLKRKEKKLPEFNTTALPDIIFMLLFFFMVVTVMKKDDDKAKVNIPKVSYAQQLKKHDNYLFISATINEAGQVQYFNGKNIYNSFEKFRTSLNNQSQKENSIGVLKAKIKIDRSITMKTVNRIKRALQDKEIYNVEYIITKDKPAETS